MPKLRWDRDTYRLFEDGIDRGVLYTWDNDSSSYLGVSWNGITSVEESSDSKTTPIYYDGQKVYDIVTVGTFLATLKAYTYPDEFLLFEGVREYEASSGGLFFDSQQRYTALGTGVFGLSYRTLIGNPCEDTDFGYKIHILYNLTAIPDSVTRQSISANVDPIEFSWALTAVPEDVPNLRPTAHVIIDSTKVTSEILKSLEKTLYGYSDPVSTFATLPFPTDLITLFS